MKFSIKKLIVSNIIPNIMHKIIVYYNNKKHTNKKTPKLITTPHINHTKHNNLWYTLTHHNTWFMPATASGAKVIIFAIRSHSSHSLCVRMSVMANPPGTPGTGRCRQIGGELWEKSGEILKSYFIKAMTNSTFWILNQILIWWKRTNK